MTDTFSDRDGTPFWVGHKVMVLEPRDEDGIDYGDVRQQMVGKWFVVERCRISDDFGQVAHLVGHFYCIPANCVRVERVFTLKKLINQYAQEAT